MADAPIHLFGIRHHGPGCARSLMRALTELQPDCLLVEGPPEGEAMLPLICDAALLPPVALLIYNPEDSREAAFYPFAAFSPEWNALRYAVERGIPTRFIDLPVGHRFALARPPEAEGEPAPPTDAASAEPDQTSEEAGASGDPLDWLGRAAGYGDGEAWWNHMVEERGDSLDLFAAIREAMSTVRAEAPQASRNEAAQHREALREAHMRKCIRLAQKDGFARIAVVCGAWHVPALAEMPSAKADNELLKALPRVKVAATWVPWSNANLSVHSGYGAGVASPGWYEHLWTTTPERRATAWLARAAALFRAEGLDCSSAHLIEAVRLADSLAALRERPQPGLDELGEALRTVVCMGDDAPMQLIARAMIVGDRLGSTPKDAPAVPLQRDIAQWQKSLRLKPEAGQKALDLDLRQANDLARSHLLHRLVLLDIGWGALSKTGRSAKGSFHEIWTLQWAPELAIAVINASRWGNSVAEAAAARAIDRALKAEALPELSALVNQVLLADLQTAIAPVTRALEDLAALASDVVQMLQALPSLANLARYGNVRKTDVGMVEHLLDRLVPRAAIGLPGACSALDDDAAQTMREAIAGAHQAVRLLEREALSEAWSAALARLATAETCHGMVAGLAARLLFDTRQTTADDTALRMSRALSAGNDPAPAAAWLEGFLNQSALVLLHDAQLWALVDDWLCTLNDAHFQRVLPLLRRAFSAFSAPERRQLGERAQRPAATAQTATQPDWDTERAERALPLLRQLLGVSQ
ncbi:DUF5682 family protein [Niveibacterium sp. 24ML]|uniref:DUF5682 family protein n=1 Tax=Niveibacterium sp. 24ML TaxID=2985512 RepID=UPI00226FD1DA|nr:DUF5682 family protein [Niveibacterium sp. 24ML]MCX9155623.1 DUF5682 family protein [Niveibacterium sp. 24ML]